MLDRRTVLKAGLIGGAVLTFGGVGLALRGSRHVEPKTPLRALSPREFATIAAVADRMFEGEGLPSARDLAVAEGVDALLATMHPETVGEIRQVLALLENALAGLVMDGRFTTFSGSSPEVQRRVLRGWATSRWPTLRTAYRALHGLCLGVAWSHPELHAFAGYPGPPPALAAFNAAPPEAP